MATQSNFFQDACLLEILMVVKRQELLLGELMTQINDMAAEMGAISAQLEKARGEIVAQVATLEASLQNVALPADAEAALANLKATAQALDDLNPDQPVA